MKKYEFSGEELTEDAFNAYCNSPVVFWMNDDGEFYYSDDEESEKYRLGSVVDVNEFLESLI